MYTAFYKASPYLDFTFVSSVLFAALFTGVIVWVLIAKRGSFDKAARLPLDEDGKQP